MESHQCCVIIGFGGGGTVEYYDVSLLNGGASCFGDIVATGGVWEAVPYYGGNGACGCGCAGTSDCAGDGGLGYISCISGTEECYAGGGGGGGQKMRNPIGGIGCYGGGHGGCSLCNPNFGGTDATTYGSGGGARTGTCPPSPIPVGEYSYTFSSGCQGVFIARYPSDCGYNITGGCKYECDGYCIHCFTQDGTLIVN